MKLHAARYILVVFVLLFAPLAVVETGVAGGKADDRVIVVSGPKQQGRIGSLHYAAREDYSGGIYAAATKAFGAPTSKKVDVAFCDVRWRPLGLEIEFTTFGPNPLCSSSSLKKSSMLQSIRVSSSIWRTDRGLRVGDSESRLQGLYPGAKHGTVTGFSTSREFWTLVKEKGHILLVANVKAGRISSFEIPSPFVS